VFPKIAGAQARKGANMNTVRTRYAPGALLLAILGIGLGTALPSFGGIQGIDDEDNAKLSRHKAQMKQMTKKGDATHATGDAASDKCGSLELGNVSNNKPGRPVREVTVIVDGPIINANNKCR
jgi:hypothetical protein